jgi:hypothetical protein
MDTGGPFPGAKVRPGRDTDRIPHLVPTSRMSRSYISIFPQASLWRVVGEIWLFFFQYLPIKDCQLFQYRITVRNLSQFVCHPLAISEPTLYLVWDCSRRLVCSSRVLCALSTAVLSLASFIQIARALKLSFSPLQQLHYIFGSYKMISHIISRTSACPSVEFTYVCMCEYFSDVCRSPMLVSTSFLNLTPS